MIGMKTIRDRIAKYHRDAARDANYDGSIEDLTAFIWNEALNGLLWRSKD